MKLENGKTYNNHYGVKITIFESPAENVCHWFKGSVNDGKPTWKLFPYYYHKDGSFVQLPDGNPKFNLIVGNPDELNKENEK